MTALSPVGTSGGFGGVGTAGGFGGFGAGYAGQPAFLGAPSAPGSPGSLTRSAGGINAIPGVYGQVGPVPQVPVDDVQREVEFNFGEARELPWGNIIQQGQAGLSDRSLTSSQRALLQNASQQGFQGAQRARGGTANMTQALLAAYPQLSAQAGGGGYQQTAFERQQGTRRGGRGGGGTRARPRSTSIQGSPVQTSLGFGGGTLMDIEGQQERQAELADLGLGGQTGAFGTAGAGQFGGGGAGDILESARRTREALLGGQQGARQAFGGRAANTAPALPARTYRHNSFDGAQGLAGRGNFAARNYAGRGSRNYDNWNDGFNQYAAGSRSAGFGQAGYAGRGSSSGFGGSRYGGAQGFNDAFGNYAYNRGYGVGGGRGNLGGFNNYAYNQGFSGNGGFDGLNNNNYAGRAGGNYAYNQGYVSNDEGYSRNSFGNQSLAGGRARRGSRFGI
jgi:hypothetical protein